MRLYAPQSTSVQLKRNLNNVHCTLKTSTLFCTLYTVHLNNLHWVYSVHSTMILARKMASLYCSLYAWFPLIIIKINLTTNLALNFCCKNEQIILFGDYLKTRIMFKMTFKNILTNWWKKKIVRIFHTTKTIKIYEIFPDIKTSARVFDKYIFILQGWRGKSDWKLCNSKILGGQISDNQGLYIISCNPILTKYLYIYTFLDCLFVCLFVCIQ